MASMTLSSRPSRSVCSFLFSSVQPGVSRMTYFGRQMVVENYNIMGVAKTALECAVRYMAAELGPKGIRVHAISPGRLATRAASGIPEFDELLAKAKVKAPARSLVT
jgi:enoyl-[acyl-carrier protein] reductase I